MPIVARHGAQETRRPRLLTPGVGGTAKAQNVGRQHEEIHEGQAAVAADQNLGLRDPQPLRRQPPGLGDAVEAAVAAGIGAVLRAVVAGKDPVQRGRQLQLRDARFAPGEIQAQPAGRELTELLPELLRPLQQRVPAVRFQMHPPPPRIDPCLPGIVNEGGRRLGRRPRIGSPFLQYATPALDSGFIAPNPRCRQASALRSG
jgi:hypothetical protein